jgi:LmbE family N-acetylglucosaminyl deacetylase
MTEALEATPVNIPMLWLVLMTVPQATDGLRLATAGDPAGPNKKLKIVVFGAHPDDPESGAGGLIAMLTREGNEVICAYGTSFRGFEVTTDQQTIGFTPELFLNIAPVRDVEKRSLDEHKSQGPEEIWQVHERMHPRRGAQCGLP